MKEWLKFFLTVNGLWGLTDLVDEIMEGKSEEKSEEDKG